MSIKVEMGSRGCPYAGTNGEKWQKIQFSGKWWENGVVIDCSSFLSKYYIETAPIDNILVHGSGGGIKGSPMSRFKW